MGQPWGDEVVEAGAALAERGEDLCGVRPVEDRHGHDDWPAGVLGEVGDEHTGQVPPCRQVVVIPGMEGVAGERALQQVADGFRVGDHGAGQSAAQLGSKGALAAAGPRSAPRIGRGLGESMLT